VLDFRLETLKKTMFKSGKGDWKGKEPWERRAILWKLTAMALYAKRDAEVMDEHYKVMMRADQHRAPTDKEMLQIAGFLQAFILKNQEKTDVKVSKEDKVEE